MIRWSTSAPRTALWVVSGLVACAVVLAALPASASSLVSDLVQLLTSGVACASAARHGLACRDARMRRSWLVLAAACGSWVLGQTYWTWAAATTGEVPFPSLADAGFLGFPLLIVLALTLYPAAGESSARWQRAWDAVMTSGAIGLIVWRTTVGAVVADSAGHDTTTRVLLLAYPVLDGALIVLAVMLLSRVRSGSSALTLVSLGVLALGVADSAFVYLAATGSYAGGLIDVGWIGGFLLIALGGSGAPHKVTSPPRRPAATRSCTSSSLLPYVPVGAASAVVLAGALAGRSLGPGEQIVAVLVVAALLGRQYLALRDNARLATDLAAREEQLRHQAFHDPLTGLANRSLFRDRLEHALDLHARDLRAVSVTFVDLDDFKVVNDTMGHAVGDQLLIRVAERLTGALRGGDTVARLGGDEFAVLLEDGGDPLEGAARIQSALGVPFIVDGHSVGVRASVGVCSLAATDPATGADQLLARSDAAMYSAKRAGKNRIVHDGTATDDRAPRPASLSV